jgi:splicing factor 45
MQASMPPVASGPSSTTVSIEEAQAKARAIAARLAMFKQPAAAAPSPSASGMTPIFNTDDPIPGLGGQSAQASAASKEPREPSNPEDFAKNLMAKYGWTKGQGLGASSQGIVNPLALSNASDGKKGGKGKGKQPESSKPAGHTKVLGMATAKGRVISDLKTEKDKAEKEKYGEPSRIVCLSNMVGRNEVDAELAEDVAGEARKLGLLESCFVHVMPAYVSDEESVRVFVVFSGLVGAWKAVKEFDGRFFGGRTVTAKFYDERAYDARALHL